MINDILTAIAERLGDTEPNLKYIDEDWGQLDYYHEHPPVKFPCVLLELQQAAWKNQGKLVQDGIIDITVRVCDIKLSNTSFKAPQQQKTNAAAIWLILENIHKALHGWRPADQSEFNTLTRISSRRVKRDDGIREFEMVYSCMAIDESATVKYYNIADPAIAADQFDTIPPIPEVEPILLINPQNLDDMALPGIVINITQSKGAAAIAPIPQTVFNLLVADDLVFSFIIRAAEGNSLKIYWGDGTTKQIAFSGEFQTITKTFAAGDFIVGFEGDISTISFISVNQMPILTGCRSESLAQIQQLHLCCCGLVQQDVDVIITAFTDETKYPELTDLDLSGQMPSAPPSIQMYANFRMARPFVEIKTDAVPFNVKYICPSDGYQTQSIATIAISGNTGLLTYWYDEYNIPQVHAIGQNSSFLYSGEGEIGLLRIWGDTDKVGTLYISEDAAITEISVKGFGSITDGYFGQNSLTNESILALLQELYVADDFPNLSTIDVSLQNTGAGITQDQFDAFFLLRPDVALTVDII